MKQYLFDGLETSHCQPASATVIRRVALLSASCEVLCGAGVPWKWNRLGCNKELAARLCGSLAFLTWILLLPMDFTRAVYVWQLRLKSNHHLKPTVGQIISSIDQADTATAQNWWDPQMHFAPGFQ